MKTLITHRITLESNIPVITTHTSGDVAACLTDIPKDCIPFELGGTLDSTLDELNEATYRNIVAMKTWFRENEKLKSDESKRDGDLRENLLFGCNGTFRALEID
ncbi:hypothetical protein RUM44_008024 [Polyplax serrata]|uniref:Uncharacterized protein n=1 Tax=Polyplax serrata TaxID=468196 RepID=A0ABR1B7M3_POLSC